MTRLKCALWFVPSNIWIGFSCIYKLYFEDSHCFCFFFIYKDLGNCRLKETRIFGSYRVHYCYAGTLRNTSSFLIFGYLLRNINLVLFCVIFVFFSKQLVSLAQAGHELTPEILKTAGEWKFILWALQFIIQQVVKNLQLLKVSRCFVLQLKTNN